MSFSAYEHSKMQVKYNEVPAFGDAKYPPENEDLFSSNITYTFDGFSNKQHRDHDENDYTFGMRFPVRRHGISFMLFITYAVANSFNLQCFADFKLATHAEGYSVTGGHFVWSEYGVGADYSKNDGVTMLIWRSKHDIHGIV